MLSFIVAITVVVIQGCLQWYNAANDNISRSSDTRRIIGWLTIFLTLLLMLLKYLDVKDMQNLQDRLRTANVTVQDNYSLSMRLSELLSYSMVDHAISKEDERLFLSIIRQSYPMHLELSAVKWTDGSYHFYWYEGSQIVAVDYFKKEEVSWFMPKLYLEDREDLISWLNEIHFAPDDALDIWELGSYPAGSAVGEIGMEMLRFLAHVGIQASKFYVDSQRKVLRFVLDEPSPHLLVNRNVVRNGVEAIVDMKEVDILALINKSRIQMRSEALTWARRTFGEEFILEPTSHIVSRWISHGNVMNFVKEE